MPATTGYTSSTRGGIALGAGVLFVGSARFGVCKAELAFDPGRDLRSVMVPGASSMIRGLDYVAGYAAKITGTLLELSTTQLQYLELSVAAVGSAPAVITPVSAMTLLPDAATNYLQNVRAVWDRQDGNFHRVTFAWAILESFSVKGEDKGTVSAAFTLAARLVPSGSPLDVTVAPYTHEISSTTP